MNMINHEIFGGGRCSEPNQAMFDASNEFGMIQVHGWIVDH